MIIQKLNAKILLSLLLAGSIAASGCGNTENTPEQAAPGQQTEQAGQTEQSGQSETGEADMTQSPDSNAASPVEADAVSSVDSDAATSADGDAAQPVDKYAGLTAEEVMNMGKPRYEQETETITGEEHSTVGIVTDATRYSVTIQTPEGNIYSLTIPETGVDGDLNAIYIGQIATFTYMGSLDESHAALTGISSSSMITGIYIEEYAFAIKIINAVKAMDKNALANLSNFPVFLSAGDFSGSVNSSGEFQKFSTDEIFSEALVERMANYNLFDLEYTDAGFVMGKDTPSITFDVDYDGILGIIGINCNEAPAVSTNDSGK